MAKLNSGTRIYGTATVDSTLAVTGATTLSSTLAVGATTITGAATVSTTLGVTGAATLSSTLAVTGIASFAAGSAAAPAITRTGDLDTGVWFPAANALGLSTSGTNAVYIDSGQKVGIGTSTPAVKLDVGYVAGDVALRVSRDANSRLDFYQGGGVSYIDSSPAGGVLAFATVGTERARIDASGNLGLGVTPSTYLSTTLPTLQLSTRSTLTADVNSTYLSCNNSGANDIYMGNSNYALKYHQDSAIGLHKWLNAPVGTAGNAITFTQAMTLDASGNLGIGTTSPTARLQSAVSRTSGTNTTALILSDNVTGVQTSGFGTQIRGLSNGGSAESAIAFEASGGTNNDTGIAFYTQASASALTRRGTFTAGGHLALGRSTSFNGGKLTMEFAPASNFITTLPSSSGAYSAAVFHNSSGTEIGTIAVSTTATAYNTSSDYRLKNTIAPMTGALAKVALLKPCTYKWNLDNSASQGFIAHELQAVVPECVTGEKDAVNEDGSIKSQGIDTSFLVATLTAAIQEQQALIQDQKVLIQSLITRLTALEAR